MVIRDNKNVGKSPNGVPVVISNIALINSVKTSDTATIDAVSETKKHCPTSEESYVWSICLF